MKMLVLSTLLAFSSQTLAASHIQCFLQEIGQNQNFKQEMRLQPSNDPHGSLINFKLKVMDQYQGFVALSNGFIVIHLYDSETNFAISTQSYGSAEKYARLQYLLPDNKTLEAIVIECAEVAL